MNRKDLLEFMKPRITTKYYEVLEIWTNIRKKTFIFDTVFDVTIVGDAYCISNTSDFLDNIYVH